MKSLLALAVALGLLGATTGCNTVTLDQAKMIAYSSSYAATAIAIQTQALKPATCAKVYPILLAAEPAVDGLSTSNDLQTVLFPTIEAQIEKVITDPKEQAIVLTIVQVALSSGTAYLNAHPDIASQKTYWSAVLKQALEGTAQAMQGSAVPAPSWRKAAKPVVSPVKPKV